MNRDISSIRRDYQFEDLLEESTPRDPMEVFDAWLNKAIEDCPEDPTAMILSTVDQEHQPHARVVLLKQRNEQGFSFFTNYSSDKGEQLTHNNSACLTFFWPSLSRQIRIEGKVTKVTRDISKNYFASRPKGSQLAAAASHQSQPLNSREELHEAFEALEKQYFDSDIPCPENWGGYILEAKYIEFWQGRPSRLHDRLSYKHENNIWKRTRLAP
ncbi:pyridoxamine 5'-phosphate oxidase [Marinomonas sp. 15G1-11]|uniref:Pyridoxine/pyridoxamine 5'-phosphate oxidase n=1 Tax=Marinomonas phaeophyticola TaxID=3004091 RepID=A0ABT4JYM0_9GAMM|nr:pyridoxamine 5'-phosphate oxidase [Marinomonas sp. 15G1-11]MCZ2722853.1 pyridoxamine 5'-phosphate oxidase [Marinomonas sp. 15G1-11]